MEERNIELKQIAKKQKTEVQKIKIAYNGIHEAFMNGLLTVKFIVLECVGYQENLFKRIDRTARDVGKGITGDRK